LLSVTDPFSFLSRLRPRKYLFSIPRARWDEARFSFPSGPSGCGLFFFLLLLLPLRKGPVFSRSSRSCHPRAETRRTKLSRSAGQKRRTSHFLFPFSTTQAAERAFFSCQKNRARLFFCFAPPKKRCLSLFFSPSGFPTRLPSPFWGLH